MIDAINYSWQFPLWVPLSLDLTFHSHWFFSSSGLIVLVLREDGLFLGDGLLVLVFSSLHDCIHGALLCALLCALLWQCNQGRVKGKGFPMETLMRRRGHWERKQIISLFIQRDFLRCSWPFSPSSSHLDSFHKSLAFDDVLIIRYFVLLSSCVSFVRLLYIIFLLWKNRDCITTSSFLMISHESCSWVSCHFHFSLLHVFMSWCVSSLV